MKFIVWQQIHQLVRLQRARNANFKWRELYELRKTPFKRELSKVILQILKNEEKNVDMHYINL